MREQQIPWAPGQKYRQKPRLRTQPTKLVNELGLRQVRAVEKRKRILLMLCLGYQRKKIAYLIGIKGRSVDDHVQGLMRFTKSKHLVQLGVWAERNGYAKGE